ncbi:hypothetical protein A9K75_06725 [Campylobacter fetus subsp. testudinum]|uniref:SPFH domain-containing protein n=1 Tax=Campylobacter fetus TaxID=196 RepID=UPI00081894AB|nr:SPFH domain-containing protein [Campylobacter fetus]OCR99559.1 hypothetical protein A9K75_06725 [Campylobacter fetus subsp. testudinum]
MNLEFLIAGVVVTVLGLVALGIVLAMFFRVVVPTNEVHIVQSAKKTTSYGKDTGNGNTYYEFPSWIPVFGITKIVLPVSVFSISINSYEAYDLGRLPFVVDITAFFRVDDSNLAAQRVKDFSDLSDQLKDIIQGSIRSILSSRSLEDILQIRSELGEDFTKAVKEQLKNWGIEPVKNIELMDIRDSANSMVIINIMNKKISVIEKESRIEVANNKKEAQLAEIEAKQVTDMKEQDALKLVGLKRVENEREVAVSEQQANQQIKEQEKITKEKQMEVVRVEKVKQAEIDKQSEIVKAEQEQRKIEIDAEARKNATIRNAEAEKEKQFLDAAALLEMKDKEAQGIQKIGGAEAEALKLKELAPINAQIELAKEIGSNAGYQQYLITIRQVEASEKVGIEQAKAISTADLKVIANGGDVQSGINKIGDIMTSKGGMNIGSMLEGLAQSEIGKNILDKFTKTDNIDKINTDISSK